MDDDSSVVSTRHGATSQVIEDIVIETKVSDAEEAKLQNCNEKKEETIPPNYRSGNFRCNRVTSRVNRNPVNINRVNRKRVRLQLYGRYRWQVS